MKRKDFIKRIGAVAGVAAFAARTEAAGNVQSLRAEGGAPVGSLPDRVLGSGRAAMSVSALGFTLSAGDIAELERAVESIPVIGDRYDAEQQKHVFG